jgi:hypothetical protein
VSTIALCGEDKPTKGLEGLGVYRVTRFMLTLDFGIWKILDFRKGLEKRSKRRAMQ